MPIPYNTAQPVYVSDLILRTKQRADIEKSGTAGVVSDSELLTYLNIYYRQLAMKIDHKYEYYRAKYYNIQTVLGQLRYPLPADFYNLLGIGLVNVPGPAPDTWTPLQPWDMVNQNIPGTGFMNFTNGMFTNMTYRVIDRQFEFKPMKSAQIVGVWYTPMAMQLRSPGDVIEEWCMPGWEEYVITGAAMLIAAKEQQAIAMLEQMWLMIDAQIDSFIPSRDSFQPQRVQRAWWGSQWPFGMFGGYFGPGQGGL